MTTTNVKWVDYAMFLRLHRDDTLIDFIFFGSSDVLKKWWYMLIPFVNIGFILGVVFAWVTIPLRVLLLIVRRRQLKKTVYDIEQNRLNYKLIRGRNSKLGLCRFYEDEFYCIANKVLIMPEYLQIIRETDIIYRLRDINDKWGLYNADKGKFIFPCEFDSIIFNSETQIILNSNMNQYKSNIYGERLID